MAKERTIITTLKCRLNQLITQRDTVNQEGTITEREIILETPDSDPIDMDLLELAEQVRDNVRNQE